MPTLPRRTFRRIKKKRYTLVLEIHAGIRKAYPSLAAPLKGLAHLDPLPIFLVLLVSAIFAPIKVV